MNCGALVAILAGRADDKFQMRWVSDLGPAPVR
jgi:hypothetical protein